MTTIPARPGHDRRAFLSLLGAAALIGPAAAACGSGAAAAPSKIDFNQLAGQTGDPETRSLKYLGDSGEVTLEELAADLGYLQDVELDFVGDSTSGPQMIQSAATRQTDFGGAFNGAVVKLIAAGAPVTALISYYGVDKYSYNGFFTKQDSPIGAAKDLLGRKVGMNTLGAHDEAVLDIYLERNKLTRAQVGQVEPIVIPPASTEEAIRLGQLDVGVLGSFLRELAQARGGLKMLFSDYQLLGNFSAGTYVMRDDFIEKNPNTVRVFITAVAKAIEWSRTTPTAEVVDRFLSIIAKRNRNESTTAIKYWQSWGVAETGGVIAQNEIQTWIDWLVTQGTLKQGQLTAAQVYTNAFNPYAKKGGSS